MAIQVFLKVGQQIDDGDCRPFGVDEVVLDEAFLLGKKGVTTR